MNKYFICYSKYLSINTGTHAKLIIVELKSDKLIFLKLIEFFMFINPRVTWERIKSDKVQFRNSKVLFCKSNKSILIK